MTDFVINIELETWQYSSDHRRIGGKLYINGLDESNGETSAHGGAPYFRSDWQDLTPSEVAQVALAMLVFATVPLEEITHNNWGRYLS